MRRFIMPLFALCLIAALVLPAMGSGSSDKYDGKKRFSKAYDLVRSGYVRDVTDDELMNGAIKGMLEALDPHSTFLNREDFKEMQEATSGEFFGVGIEITSQNNQLVVVSPIDDTPAHKAGLKAGDIILAVDGQSTQDMTTQEAVSRIRGPKGTEVELLLLGKEDSAPRTVKIVRDAIPLISVRVRFLDDDGYLWVRLSRFNDKTTSELLEALREKGKKAEIKGIVLDLRNNPGGLFKQSVTVSNIFLKEGAIVSMRGRGGRVLESHSAKSTLSDVSCPLVVLVNRGSASASEIVAGALQDNNRAVIVGESTFGKGSVQKIEPLGDGTAIKMTIARYYTPKGRDIQAEGIVPDIVVAFEPPRDSDAARPPRISTPRERDLSRHLESGAARNRGDETERPRLLEDDTRRLLERDNQLRIALQLVRGLPRMSEVQIQ